MYKLPEKSFTDDSRVRVKKYDNTLLIYHALTNDLICKHKITDGTGNIVSLPQDTKIVSIEEEMHLYYKADEIAIKFLELMRKQKPRYVYPQCDRLRRMQKYYSDGEEKARKYLSHNSYRHYLERSLKINESEING